jgi:hypothetical protein
MMKGIIGRTAQIRKPGNIPLIEPIRICMKLMAFTPACCGSNACSPRTYGQEPCRGINRFVNHGFQSHLGEMLEPALVQLSLWNVSACVLPDQTGAMFF